MKHWDANPLILLSYLFATVLFIMYVRQGFRSEDPAIRRQFGGGGVASLAIGTLAQLFALIQIARDGRGVFLDLSSALTGLSVSWVVLGIIFIVKMRVYTLGLIVAPIALAAEAAIAALPEFQVTAYPRLSGNVSIPGLVFHAVCGYSGYSAFFVATLGSAMFIFQDRQLREKRFAFYFEQIPSLERSAKIISLGIIGGLALFAATIASSAIFLAGVVPTSELLVDANIHTVVALWLYAAVIWMLARKGGWAQIRIAYMALLLGGLAMILRAIFAFGAGIHAFSQV